eukprot:CAMPEP_0113548080 /NCGR_PEP_ID=MMETSP0015_2-20120614/12702_1 /TAXON_ID=2838 /ORGANISM="Odontella" /LENGTH=280 /DNA_ID=CAMNT_0000448685 /DNA_START=200 /DNA_END=1042 /DNA_ORIENTATION=+ /assembly_acc=CAM_ASM_000160
MAATITEEARRNANLRVLQRLDSSILDIAGSATHVVLYEFDNSEQKWEKRNVEGSLFVSKRSDSPRFKLVVLNRNSRDNFEVPVTGKFQMQVRDPYLIFREEKAGNQTKILGIWFHDGKEREAVSVLLKKIVDSLSRIEEMEEQHAENGKQVLGEQQTASSSEDAKGDAPVENEQSPVVDEDAAASALLSPLTLSQQGGDSSTAATALAPSSGSAASPSPGQNASPQNLVLDKKSLQLSLLSLIQDERFLDLIHAQYLKVVHTRANRDVQQKSGSSGNGN